MATSTRRHSREPPSVPFLWEEKPGIPKKDWRPTIYSNNATPTPPVKLIASVPFVWEEKPGTPLPYFSERSTALPMKLITFPGFPSPPASSHNDHDRDDYNNNVEGCDFRTDDSFSSAPSLLANCLVSSMMISRAVPAADIESDQTDTETPSSPLSETGSTTSSCATGASSLVGASFLECLFPLLPANAGSLQKIGYSDNHTLALTPIQSNSKFFDRESSSSVILRPRTLGELILMSRKLSYRRKAVQMRKNNLSKEFVTKVAFGCGIFGTGSKFIEGLHSKTKNFLT